jgi:hypothetical protein
MRYQFNSRRWQFAHGGDAEGDRRNTLERVEFKESFDANSDEEALEKILTIMSHASFYWNCRPYPVEPISLLRELDISGSHCRKAA